MFLGQLAALLERRRLTAAAGGGGGEQQGEQERAARGWPASITRLHAMAEAHKALPYRLTDSQARLDGFF